MKLFTRVFAAVVALVALFGCQTDPTVTTPVGAGDGTTISISLEPTRTSLGEKSGETYPLYWSEGDRLAINGIASGEAVIDASNKSLATFTVSSTVSEPYHITYPYSAELNGAASKVIFPGEQSHVEGTFAKDCAPMCGYVAKSGNNVELKHLAGVLRFPVRASAEGVILDKVVITSLDNTKLAGEFTVDCTTATITAGATAINSITYTLPDNFALSTTADKVLYITIPAVETGACSIDFVTASGEKMTRSWSNRTIKPGIVKEFKTINYSAGIGGELEALDSYQDEFVIFYENVYGYVKDTNGTPLKGVAISDGFQVVATDANGYYEMTVTKDTWYIYISLPSEYEVPINEFGQPCFYQPYPKNSPQYDFTLTPMAGGKEEKFALFTIGDPQVRNSSQFNRCVSEAIPAIKNHSQDVKAQGIPCYGITLGDIIANSDGTNTSSLRDDMRDAFHIDKAGLPVFQVYGNHDNTYFGSGVTISADERSSTFELKAQREHEAMFGPINYSFNRGDVHVVGMRNIIYKYDYQSGKYDEGFMKHQYEWLKQDLALVPKDKMVVLCVHAPVYRATGNYVEEIQALLNEFKEGHIVSGHTHYSKNYEYIAENPSTPYPKLYDHNVGALCGVWWRGNIAEDGAPTGYNVFVCNGNEFTESYFMGVNNGMNTKEKQMRLYRGNAITGRERKSTDTYAKTGYFAFNFGEDYLLANIYNADTKWVIKVYEDGVHTGNMEKVPVVKPSSMIGSYTYDDPRRAAEGVVSCVDMYTAAFYYNYYEGRSAWSDCNHLYKYQLKNKDAKIKVEATDRYGNIFTEETITEGTDYSLVAR